MLFSNINMSGMQKVIELNVFADCSRRRALSAQITGSPFKSDRRV